MNANQQIVQLKRSMSECRFHEERAEKASVANLPRLAWLRDLHEAVAKDFGEALSDLLRMDAEVRLVDCDQSELGRLLDDLESPACLHIFKAVCNEQAGSTTAEDEEKHEAPAISARFPPCDGRLMLDLDPAILHPMLDRLLGGMVVDEPPPGRPLTEIELRLTSRVVRLFLDAFVAAWRQRIARNAADLDISIVRVESNPRLSRILPHGEPLLVFGFEIVLGKVRGTMRWCISPRWVAAQDDDHESVAPSSLRFPLPCPSVSVDVTLAETPISGADLAGLRVGDIIVTETEMDSPATASIDGLGRFHAKPGVFQGRKAVRLIAQIEEQPSREGRSAEHGEE
jgi:flagellar motor switch protein FliM